MSETNNPEQRSLADAIIPLHEAAVIPEPLEGEGVVVDVLADKTLARDGKVFTLRPDVLVLNGLLLLRDQGSVSGNAIRDRVGFPFGSVVLHNRLSALRKGLTELTGNEQALQSCGSGTSRRHQLAPWLVFRDRRLLSEGGTNNAIALKRGQFLDKDADKIVAWRREALSSLFRAYKDHPQVRAVSDRLAIQARQARAQDARLKPEVINEHFDRIEKGLDTYSNLQERPGDDLLRIDATISYHTLLLSTLTPARARAVQYARSYDIRLSDDLWNACMEEIAEVIMNRGAYDATESFYGLCVVAITSHMKEVVSADKAARAYVSMKEIQLRAKIASAFCDLEARLQRQPTLAELKAELPANIRRKSITIDELESIVYRLRHPTLWLDRYEDWFTEKLLVERMEGLDAEEFRLDQQLNAMLSQEVAEQILSSPKLTDMERVVLSLHSGIFSPSLCGTELVHLQKKTTFTYPYDKASFDELTQPLIESGEGIANLLSYTRARINNLLRGVRPKAAEIAEKSWDFNSDEGW